MMQSAVADRIKSLRVSLNLTQKQLAEKLNISDKAISKWERRLSYPDVTLLAPLSRALGVTIDEARTVARRNLPAAIPKRWV